MCKPEVDVPLSIILEPDSAKLAGQIPRDSPVSVSPALRFSLGTSVLALRGLLVEPRSLHLSDKD